ncbi:MAG: adenosylcobalamin-dependent ribonucleoside-diphosphate reductase, partial [Chloroflexi bacterium]|nr:adenosylcobalamin-dependent ribonucleoside-diphosphate reductase [Chloroflexota bacterium]
MRIDRRFTTAGQDPYEGVRFGSRDSRIVNPDGSAVFEAADVTMPADWSQVAVDIMAQKYFRKTGVTDDLATVEEDGVPSWLWRSVPASAEAGAEDGFEGETDARQVFHRLAGTWAYWGWKHGYFDGEDDARAFYDELVFMMATQRAAPNSPQWFNTGLHWAYGIAGPAQGHSFVDPDSGALSRSTSAYERPQPHACFIQSVADDLVGDGGIMDLWTREARIFKYGSGTGSNFSDIRGENEPLSGGGKSSGLMSFLKIGDRAAGAIKSGGTTRRAAKMVIVDADHPDVEQFIDWKASEEQKVAALVTGSRTIRKRLRAIVESTADGLDPADNRRLRRAVSRARRDAVPEAYVQRVLQLVEQDAEVIDFTEFDTDWQGEAYQTVSGQNANNSVRVTADFLDAVREDRDWNLVRRTDGEIAKTLPARELWDRVALAAWQSADPGVQYDTTINEWHTAPAGGAIRGSNPCSEYMFLDDTACNLASLNLLRFYDEETRTFDTEAYTHASRLWTIVLEISVLMAQYPSPAIAQLSHDYRTLGLGYANLGALLMVQGIPYDSPEALAQTGAYTALLTGVSYATSAEMARELGAFPEYDANRDAMLRVIRNHRRAAHDAPEGEYEGLTVLPRGLDAAHCPEPIVKAAREAWDEALALGEAHGYRNAQTTLIAPTGTIGLLMDCDTTGVEPDFALV